MKMSRYFVEKNLLKILIDFLNEFILINLFSLLYSMYNNTVCL